MLIIGTYSPGMARRGTERHPGGSVFVRTAGTTAVAVAFNSTINNQV